MRGWRGFFEDPDSGVPIEPQTIWHELGWLAAGSCALALVAVGLVTLL